jgi:hypothetical protein
MCIGIASGFLIFILYFIEMRRTFPVLKYEDGHRDTQTDRCNSLQSICVHCMNIVHGTYSI